jgi:hypothetical protein
MVQFDLDGGSWFPLLVERGYGGLIGPQPVERVGGTSVGPGILPSSPPAVSTIPPAGTPMMDMCEEKTDKPIVVVGRVGVEVEMEVDDDDVAVLIPNRP